MEQNTCLVICLTKIFPLNESLLNVSSMLKDVNLPIIKGSHKFNALKKMKIFVKSACNVSINELELNYWNESKRYI